MPYARRRPRHARGAGRQPGRAGGRRAATRTRGGGARAKAPKRGFVVYVDTTRIVIDLTAADGIRPGTVVSLRRDAIPIVHPVTGELLGELDEEVATGKVIEMRENFSVAEIQTVGRGAEIQIKDRVVPDAPARAHRPPSSESSRSASLWSAATWPRRGRDPPRARLAGRPHPGDGRVHRGSGRQAPAPHPPAPGRAPGGLPRAARVRLACVVELLHTATLIHDDVVDQAPLRRGRPSANAQWGDDASVLVGDHLYSKSFAMLVRDNDRAVMETLARATVSMTEAEVFQLELATRHHDRGGLPPDHHAEDRLVHLRMRRIGGLLGARRPAVEALTRYGLEHRHRFQISDDSLDFVADQDRLGKAIGADLREGKRTLPLIAMLERATPTEAARIQACSSAPPSMPRRSTRSGGAWSTTTAWSTRWHARTSTRRRPRATSRPSPVRGAGDPGADRGLRRRSRSLTWRSSR